MKNPLPENFIEMLRTLLGDEANLLIHALNEAPLTSVRLNKRKNLAVFSETEPVKWCDSGFYLKERPEFILDPLLHAGAYYVQDASSMIYETVTHTLVEKLQEEKGHTINYIKVLDLCAAPGGKTTAMINALPDEAEITANEYSVKRITALRENIQRWGFPNVTITNHDSSFFAKQGETFDIIAVDAPCSGEGMMRKEEMARTQWSIKLISQCAVLQKEILKNAVECLKPGGFLIYSTCTFNIEENEKNAEFIEKQLNLNAVDLNFKEEWGIMNGINTTLPVYRFMPHKTKGEGLFLSVFRKPGDWEPTKNQNKKLHLLKDKNEEFPKVEVNKETAISYLRGESIVLDPETPKGVVTITYKGLPLGEAKNIGTRANNLYPKNRRILKR